MEVVNSFGEGLQQDGHIKQQRETTLREAVNISLFDEGDYTGVRTMLGTIRSLNTGAPIEAITAYCHIDGVNTYGAVIFTRTEIKFYKTNPDQLITLASGFEFSDRISAQYYSDRNANVLYWTDGQSPMRKLILSNTVELPPSKRAMSLRQIAPIDIIRFKETRENGSLHAGSYIFFYRYYSTMDCSTSAISNATTVICVGSDNTSKSDRKAGGIVGEPVNRQIVLNIDTNVGVEHFDSVQLLVIKNTDGSKFAQTSGWLTEPRKDWMNGEIVYSGEGKEILVDLADYMTEDLAIVAANSVIIDSQMMYLGGFTLNQFDGDPTVTNAELIQEEIDSYSDEHTASTKVGYFRDEVYAYAAKYTDDYGNSIAIPLDLSQFEDNKSESWTWRFPDRLENSILTKNSKPNVLGLKISLKDHPSWARNVEIVRRKRIRDIIGQTPHIPCVGIQGVPQALIWKEVNIAGEGKVKRVDIDYDKQWDFIIPKIHQHGNARNIISNRDDRFIFEGMKLYYWAEWERQYQLGEGREIGKVIFTTIPEFMYTQDEQAFRTEFADGYKAKIIDGCLFKREMIIDEESEEAQEADLLDLTIRRCNVFSAHDQGQYLNREGDIVDGFITIRDTADIINVMKSLGAYDEIIREETGISYQLPQPLASSGQVIPKNAFSEIDINLYGYLLELAQKQYEHDSVPASIAEFFLPNYKNQRGLIMSTSEAIMDLTTYAIVPGAELFDVDFNINTDASTDIPTAGVSLKRPYGNDDNKGFYNDIAAADGEGICASWIFNIQKGLGDDRYGSIGSGGEWITTGAAKVISSPDEEIEFEVFGGDCFINLHSFKIHETTPKPIAYKPYVDFLGDQTNADGLSANEIAAGVVSAFTQLPTLYLSKTGAYRRNIEVIDVWLESTVNADMAAIKGRYPIERDKLMNNFNDDWEYYYHPQYSAENDVKIYVGREDLCQGDERYPHGIAHSDIRVRGGQNNPFVDLYGFDKYRVNNFKLYDAKYGEIQHLLSLGDRALYIFQDRAIAYQSLGVELLRNADGVITATGTGEVFGRDTFYNPAEVGTQHKNSVVVYNNTIYGTDVLKRKVYMFGSRFSSFDYIGDKHNDSFFESFLPGANLVAHIDEHFERYILTNNNQDINSIAWNMKAQYWETKFKTKNIDYGISIDKDVIWWNDGVAHKAYQGVRGTYFDIVEPVYFSYIVNHHRSLAKVFKTVSGNTLGELHSLRCVVPHESQDQDTGVLPFNYYHKNHQYWQNMLRDINHSTRAKLRGEAMIVTIIMGEGLDSGRESIIYSMTTKIRQSL